MDYFYADQQRAVPVRRADRAAPSSGLIDGGFGDRLLLSQDVFLKMMLTRHGGFGYAYVLRHFVPRLRRHGVAEEAIEAMLVDNPRRVFSSRWPNGEQECLKVARPGCCSPASAGSARPPTTRASTSSARSPSISAPSRWSRRSQDSAFELTYMPAHEAAAAFPLTLEALAALRRRDPLRPRRQHAAAAPGRLAQGQDPVPNRLKLLRDYVAGGGGLMMIGGYFSFQGINGGARWHKTPVEEVLPVACLPYRRPDRGPGGLPRRAHRAGPSDPRGPRRRMAAPARPQRGAAQDPRRTSSCWPAPAEQGGHPAAGRRHLRQGPHARLDLRHRPALAAAASSPGPATPGSGGRRSPGSRVRARHGTCSLLPCRGRRESRRRAGQPRMARRRSRLAAGQSACAS